MFYAASVDTEGVRHETRTNICPYGHIYGPGLVLVGWAPCICPPAWNWVKGHRTTQCEQCRAEGWTTIRYKPHHPLGGHPGR